MIAQERKIQEARVLSHVDAGDLQREINVYLKRGWELRGELNVCRPIQGYNYYRFSQMMVKREDQ